MVAFRGDYSAGTIVVKTNERRLYYVMGAGRAIRYPVGVGRSGKQLVGWVEHLRNPSIESSKGDGFRYRSTILRTLARRFSTHSDRTMAALTKPRMTVDEFMTWAEERPGRYELFRGEVYAKSPENVGNTEAKGAIYRALIAGIREGRLPCRALPDGATVRIDDATAYEPDALVYCGDKLSPAALEVPNPVIVVEVLSPSTRRVDVSLKLAGYFRLPSVAHYLIVDPTQPNVIHHSRGTGDAILTRIITEGVIGLDPPGLDLAIADIYGDLQS